MTEEENTLLARWLNNEITEEEKRQLEHSGDAETLRRIVATVDTWSLPEIGEEVFTDIQSKIGEKKEAKIIPFYQQRSFLAIAAGIALIAGLFFMLRPYFMSQAVMTEFACNAGEIKEIILSDQTRIVLYGKSKIKYDSEGFKSERKLNLEGEAYFEVNQKGAFEVNFERGQVSVLGTKFNVLATKEEAAVKCYEGKVEVKIDNAPAILTPGKGVRKTGVGGFSEFEFKAELLPVTGNYRLIENTPLEEVCNTLSVFYDVKIVNENVDMKRSFTGQINQNSLDSALTMIFTPMDIAFKKENNTITISNK
jgi:ferric-dicitrate binding protein FerR (iron transport regulator)